MKKLGPRLEVVRPSLPPRSWFDEYVRRIWDSRRLTNNGPLVQELERRLRSRFGGAGVTLTANGTLALQLLYRSVFHRGQRIVTTPFTFAATTTAMVWEGLSPRFVDIDPETFNLDPEAVAGELERGSDGVVGVHVFGNPAGAREIVHHARRHSAPAVFDAAHAFGVRIGSQPLVTLGRASALSFHATKNFHTFEGGAVVSRDPSIHRQVRLLRAFGMAQPDGMPLVAGVNAKLSEIHAAMGLANLRCVRAWIRARGERYRLYQELLAPLGSVQFQRLERCEYNYIYMPVAFGTSRARDRVRRILLAHGVSTRAYFSPPTSQYPFIPRTDRGACPNARSLAGRILALPLYPDLPLSEVHRVARLIRHALS